MLLIYIALACEPSHSTTPPIPGESEELKSPPEGVPSYCAPLDLLTSQVPTALRRPLCSTATSVIDVQR
ncbi:MAG: hypothetical protein AAGA48_34905 [Myxococcota bacterium]